MWNATTSPTATATTDSATNVAFAARFDGESLFSSDYNARLLKERMLARADQLKSRTAVHHNQTERANLARTGAIPSVAASHEVKAGNQFRHMALRA